jgi:hypothetical protein
MIEDCSNFDFFIENWCSRHGKLMHVFFKKAGKKPWNFVKSS